MSCTGKTGQALKDCQAAAKKAKGYQAGDGLKGTVADLNSVNFKNKHVMKWSKPAPRKANKPDSEQVRGLGQLGRTTRVPRLGMKKKK